LEDFPKSDDLKALVERLESGEEFGGVEISKPMLERTDPQQDAKRFVDGMGELRRRAELRRLEEAAKQFLRDTDMGPIADHMSVHAWMAAFAYQQLSKRKRPAREYGAPQWVAITVSLPDPGEVKLWNRKLSGHPVVGFLDAERKRVFRSGGGAIPEWVGEFDAWTDIPTPYDKEATK